MEHAEVVREAVIAAHGDLEKFKSIVAENDELLRVEAPWRETPLQAAAHTANRSVLEYLLGRGVELDVLAATVLGMSVTVQTLLERNPELAHICGAHNLPLTFHAAYAGEQAVLERIIAAGGDVNAGDGAMTALHATVAASRPEIARWLLERGANPNPIAFDKATPLLTAIKRGDLELMDVLAQSGARAKPENAGEDFWQELEIENNIQDVYAWLERHDV